MYRLLSRSSAILVDRMLKASSQAMIVCIYFLIICVSLNWKNVSASITDESQEQLIESAEYYWRDYNGIIPNDAIPGGFDRSGNPTYIGQITYRGPRLLPATIYKGCNTAYSTVYGKEISDDTHIKILCSKNQEKYSWIPTRYEDLHLLTNCQLIVGGMEKGDTLYIGRIYHDRKTRIGKIFESHTSHEGLVVPYKGKEVKYMSFEVLAYNCTVNEICSVITVESV